VDVEKGQKMKSLFVLGIFALGFIALCNDVVFNWAMTNVPWLLGIVAGAVFLLLCVTVFFAFVLAIGSDQDND
jgi:hypothetical protein